MRRKKPEKAKQEQMPRYRMRLPVVAARNGLAFTPQDALGVVRIPLRTYDMHSEETRRAMIDKLSRGLANLRKGDYHLLSVPSAANPAEWAQQWKGYVQSEESGFRPQAGFEPYTMAQADWMGRAPRWSKSVFLVSLLHRRDPDTLKGWLSHLRRAAGINEYDVEEDELSLARQSLGRFHRAMSGATGARLATVEEIMWLVRSSAWSGSLPPPPRHTRDTYGPRVLASVDGGSYIDHGDVLEQVSPQHRWLAWCAVDEVPDAVVVPGGEWLYHPAVPMQVSVRFSLTPRHEMRQKVKRAQRRIEDQYEQLGPVGDGQAALGSEIPPELAEVRTGLQEMERSIIDSDAPVITDAYVHTMLWADDREGLDRRLSMAEDSFRDLDCVLRLVTEDQRRLHSASVLGGRLGKTMGLVRQPYDHVMSVRALAAGGLTATSTIGDGKGFLLGWTPDGRPVHRDHFGTLRSAQAEPPGVIITGTTGSGKSVALGKQMVEAALAGAATTLVDPGNSFEGLVRWARKTKAFPVRLRTLGEDAEDAGLLDPFGLLPELDKAGELALQVCQMLLPSQYAFRHEGALVNAVAQAKQADRPNMHAVVSALKADKSNSENELIAEALKHASRSAVGRMCFGTSNAVAEPLESGLTVLQVRGLSLPDTDTPPDRYTAVDRQALTAAFLVAQFVTATLTNLPTSHPKAVGYDEVWMLANSEIGRRSIPDLFRTVRKLNGVPFAASQVISGDFFGDELEANVGLRMSGKVKSGSQAQAAVALHGLEDNPTNRRTFIDLEAGQFVCTEGDATAQVAVDVVFEDLLKHLDSRPNAEWRKEVAKEKKGLVSA